MNRNTAVFAISSGITAAALIALRVFDRKQETMHTTRMINLERETRNIRDAKEYSALITELDRKIEAGKFWLIVTQL